MEKNIYDKIYLGVVVDNNDPDRQNRCRVRVINVFDGIPVEHIPWAVPWKNPDGLSSSLPDNGKVVSIEFENEDLYAPVYRFSEHYNINLENKLKELSEDDYLSMKALIFDHRTQIYSNESEGLKLDFKYNILNLTNESIDMLLKSNLGKINIGTTGADQQAILGNNYMDWFDDFVDIMLGNQGGAFYGNLMAPVVTHPALIKHLILYKTLKETKFLSHNVSLNDNGSIKDITRPSIDQKGDAWGSIADSNNITNTTETDYTVTYKAHVSSTPETESTITTTTPSNGKTPNADRLREEMTKLGYKEKGEEISNGGDITKEMADYGIAVLKKIKELYPKLNIKVTGGNDRFHQKLSYNSRHKKGTGLDFVISPSTKNDVNNVEGILKSFAAGGEGKARFINEYKSPTKAASGFHFHISWGGGTEGQAVLNTAIAQAKAGEISVYKIA